MTEAEWLGCTDPKPMLEFLQVGIIALVDELPTEPGRQVMRRFLQGKTIPRKLALFACACCREIWQVVTEVSSRKAVEVAEQSLDALADEHQLEVATFAAHDARNAIEHKRGGDRAETHIRRTAADACWEAASAVWCARGFGSSVERAAQESADVAAWVALSSNFSDARAKQTQILRCIVGNPFRLFPIDPSWLAWHDGLVVRLAQAAYDERALPAGTLEPQRLAILADALEEAGGTDAAILGHLRGPGPHVRGCWPVDLLLGRS